MNPKIEAEIRNRLEADFKMIAEQVPNKRFLTSPYISSSIIKITEDMVKKYGTELKMGYHSLLRVVEPIAKTIEKKYFNQD